MEINVTPEHIAKAERILLPDGFTFDEERIGFIKNFETLDLQAVPGSGKTTTLLAKLIVLENFFPLPENAGVLVLSHTNAAIEEIKERLLPHCPKLFSYPNFVGTIQSFVDVFLCVPCYTNRHKRKPYRIDEEIYEQNHFMPYQSGGYLNRRGDGQKMLKKSRLHGNDDLKYGFGTSGTFPLNNKKSGTYKGLVNLKRGLRNKGILCYDDAYIIGSEYIEKHPKVIQLIQERFKFVFVDEMQDMDFHQYEILEKLFYNKKNAKCSYQRIGDKNQSIFSGTAKLDAIWNNRDKVLNINGSHRLTPSVAQLVNCFALERNEGFQVIGLRKGTIKPHLIVFDNTNIKDVLLKYSEIINQFTANGDLVLEKGNKVKAIGWRKENPTEGKLGLSDYLSEFNLENHQTKIDFSCLESYLINIDSSKRTFKTYRTNLLNALLRILRFEKVVNSEGRFFSKRTLSKMMKENFLEEYEDLKLNIYQWSLNLVKGKHEETLVSIQQYIPVFLNLFQKQVANSNNFVTQRVTAPIKTPTKEQASQSLVNKVNFHGFDIKLATIHSAKGQTHKATLYLETDFNAICESERLSSQFKFNNIQGDEAIRIKQSSKMCYVGLSRPTDLLCIAVHKSRFDKHLSDIDLTKWELVEM